MLFGECWNSTGREESLMRGAVYNLGIPNAILNSVNRISRTAQSFRFAMQLSFVILGLAIAAVAADWSEPEQQLARKIVAVTGPGAVALTVENRSSLGKRDSEIVQNGLRSCARRARASLCKSRAVSRYGCDFSFRKSSVVRVGGGDSPGCRRVMRW